MYQNLPCSSSYFNSFFYLKVPERPDTFNQLLFPFEPESLEKVEGVTSLPSVTESSAASDLSFKHPKTPPMSSTPIRKVSPVEQVKASVDEKKKWVFSRNIIRRSAASCNGLSTKPPPHQTL